MRFNGDDRVVLLDFATFDDAPTEGTRLIPFAGKLYFGGVRNVWSVPIAGGEPRALVRARIRSGSLQVMLVDEHGIYFRERNRVQGIDLKRVGLSGATPGEDPGAWQPEADAGVPDAGTEDGGVGLPPEAPGVTLLRRGFVLSGTSTVGIADGFVYWFSNALNGGDVVRAPFSGGDEEKVAGIPVNGGATDLASDGRDVLYLVSSSTGGLVYRVDGDRGTVLHQLGLLNGGTPRTLRLDATTAWFIAGGGNAARIHRIPRLRGVDAGVMITDAGVDAGP